VLTDDGETHRTAITLPGWAGPYLNSLALSPNGKLVAFQTSNGRLFVRGLHGGASKEMRARVGFGSTPVWSRDSTHLSYVAAAGRYAVADARTRAVRLLASASGGVGPYALSSDGRRAAAVSTDGKQILLQDTTNGQVVRSYGLGLDAVSYYDPAHPLQLDTALTFSPDGQFLLYANTSFGPSGDSYGSAVRRLALGPGRITTLTWTSDWGPAIAISPDSAFAYVDGSSGLERVPLRTHASTVTLEHVPAYDLVTAGG
jgi:WD40 repeat protein